MEDKAVISRIGLVWLLLFSCVVSAQTGSEYLQQGNVYFKEQAYSLAIEAYLKALRMGVRSGILFHNMGVAFYRSERYPEARACFKKSAKDPAFTHLALLNLGLVSIKQEDLKEAERWLSKIDTEQAPAKVATSARKLLDRVRDESRKRNPKRWIGFVFGSSGFENTSLPDELADTAQAQDENNGYLDMSLFASKQVAGGLKRALHVYASGYVLANSTASSNDLQFATAGLEGENRTGNWRQILSAAFTYMYLDSQPYQSTVEAMAKLKWRPNQRKEWELRYQIQDQSALDNAYDSITGWVQRLRITYRNRWRHGYWRSYIEYENNGRDVDYIGVNFPNYVPRRWKARSEIIPRFWGWDTLWRLEYRQSEDIGDAFGDLVDSRDNVRYLVLNRWTKPWGERFEYGWELEYLDQNADSASFDYQRTRLSLLMSWRYF